MSVKDTAHQERMTTESYLAGCTVLALSMAAIYNYKKKSKPNSKQSVNKPGSELLIINEI